LTLAGSIINSGTITVRPGADLQTGSGDATLTGGGSVTLQRNTGDYNNADITGWSTTSATTLHNVDNTISGAGAIGPGAYKANYLLALDNQAAGIVDATGNADSTLTIATSAGVNNAGTIEDTGTAGLIIQNTTVTQSGAGVIEAIDAGTHVDLEGVTIDGGTLTTAGGGMIEIKVGSGSTKLDGSTAAGAVDNFGAIVVNGAALVLAGAIDNSGTISLDSGNQLEIASGDATLTGGGTIVMKRSPGDNNNDTLTGTSAIAAVTLHNVDNTISGSGDIGSGGYPSNLLTLDNQAAGVIDATDNADATLTIATSAGVSNAGTIEATGTAGLIIQNTTVTQSGAGVIEAIGAGTHVDLEGATVDGGTLTTMGGGVIQTKSGLGSAKLDGSTEAGAVDNLGATVVNGAALVLVGAIDNSGSISLDSGNQLEIASGDATLTGGGTIVMKRSPGDNNNDTLTGTSAITPATLHNVDNTISGSGVIGSGGYPSNLLALDNQAAGVIDATDNAGGQLTIDTGNGSVTTTNAGLIEGTGTAGLLIQATALDNSGGTISAGTGSRVDLQNSVIYGGTLQTSGTGIIDTVDSGSTLNGASVGGALTNSGAVAVNSGDTLTVAGTIHNTGSITVGRSGAATLDAGATFDGHGDISLTDNAGNILGGGFENVDNLISGAGTVSATITNDTGGVIAADFADNALTLQTGTAITNNGTFEANGGVLSVSDAVTGTGHAIITAGGSMQFAKDFQQDVAFNGGASAGSLQLADAYSGTVTGFSTGDSIDLAFLSADPTDSKVYTPNGGGTGGVLSILDAGAHTLATLNLSGSYSGSSEFSLGHDSQNHMTVSILAAPVIAGTATANITDKQTATPFSAVTVTDADATVNGITATITFAAADGSFTAASLLAAGFTGSNGSYATAAGVTAATLQADLRQLVFVPTAHQLAPGQSVTTDFTLALDDGHGGTASNATTTVVATAADDPPVIAGTATAHISDKQTATPFSAVTVTDADATVNGITATITFAAADGSFTAASLLAAGFTGSNGSYSTTAGASAATLQADLRQLVFTPTAHQVAPGSAVTTDFTLALNDQHGGTPSDATTAVVATAADDPPVIAGTATAHISDKQTATPFSAVTLTDVDAGVNGITAAITFAGADGSFTAASLLAAGFTGSNGSYSTTAGASAATLQADLRQLVFTPTAHQVAPGSAVTTDFTLTLNDQHGGVPSDATTSVIATDLTYVLPPTSAALVQESNGALDYLEFSGPNLVASDLVSSFTSWNIGAEGDFNNDGRTDLVSQDPNSGAIDLLFLQNGALQGSQLEQGNYWKVVGAGNYDGSGKTGIATQDPTTGQIDLLWFTGTQLSASELLSGSYQPIVGTADFNGDGKTDFVTQSQGGGPLDFLFFNNTTLTASSLTSQSFSPVHDATNTGVPGQSVLLSQDPTSGQIDYLGFNGTSFASSQFESTNLAGLTVLQGTQVAAELFSHV
jgi:plastocyanin